MANMTVELAASHNHLEEEVQEATLELAGQKDEAERANTAKSRFLAASQPTCGNPACPVAVLCRPAAPGAQWHGAGTARLAEQISASTSLLGELLDSLLDISRLDVAGSSRRPPDATATDIPAPGRLLPPCRSRPQDDPAFPAIGTLGGNRPGDARNG